MINLTYINNILVFDDINYSIGDIFKIGDDQVCVQLYNDIYNSMYQFVAYDTTINDVIQTSADMIIETLKNG